MDKADKAMALAIDNAARIESTARLIRSSINNLVEVRFGTVKDGATYFGDVRGGEGCVIVTFSGAGAPLILNNVLIASGASPLVAEIKSSGELSLATVKTDARAMLIACG